MKFFSTAYLALISHICKEKSASKYIATWPHWVRAIKQRKADRLYDTGYGSRLHTSGLCSFFKKLLGILLSLTSKWSLCPIAITKLTQAQGIINKLPVNCLCASPVGWCLAWHLKKKLRVIIYQILLCTPYDCTAVYSIPVLLNTYTVWYQCLMLLLDLLTELTCQWHMHVLWAMKYFFFVTQNHWILHTL